MPATCRGGWSALLLAALALAPACTFEDTEPPVPPSGTLLPAATAAGTPAGPPRAATLGPVGGALSSADGRAVLTVPSGALVSPTSFTITPITNRARGGVAAAYRIDAAGRLAGPVRLTLRGPESYPQGIGLASLGIAFQDAHGFWQPVGGVVRDAGANTLTVETPHLSDWAVVLLGTPALEGTFTLVQRYGDVPFTATGTATLFRDPDSPDPFFLVTGSATLPAEIRVGTTICVPAVATRPLVISTAEIRNARFRWGLNASWGVTCTDAGGASASMVVSTVFDTMGINLARCTGAYVGTQVNGAEFVQGSYTTDCAAEGTVSATWDYRLCTAGGVCQPSNPCQTGVVTCAAGIPSCTVTGTSSNGASCGTDLVCSDGACVSCVAGQACTPANPCHHGLVTCAAGPACEDTGLLVGDGEACGVNAVCGGGACNACEAGASCPSGDPCRTGAVACNTGLPVCVQSGNEPDGTGCGTNLVCSAGVCVACTSGAACTPADPCHAGTQGCAAGPVCVDTGTVLADGSSCGPNAVCGGGTCNACTVGASCPPPSGDPCRVGTLTCDTGFSVCVESGNAPDGTSCGANLVCAAGACLACTPGEACVPPGDPCHAGSLSCAAGPVCTATATPVANGTSCGDGLVCRDGACLACAAGTVCTLGNPCETAAISCTTGSPVCTSTGPVPDGTGCGTGLACAAGQCLCAAGAACASGNPCKTGGAIACDTGAPVCAEVDVADGTPCGEGLTCTGGVCG